MWVKLDRETWFLAAEIGGGGFGQVVEARSAGGEVAVAKLVPKEPGADRELLFADLGHAQNVIPVLDSGETESAWVLVMPRAEKSLREELNRVSGAVGVATAITILKDVATALAGLDGRVVHRDVKPGNILLLNGNWCLADFGISRYAEATTSPDTRKYSLTPEYAAPEQWRGERATIAADVYALGVVAHELLAGSKPFAGPDFREQHLGQSPPHLDAAPPALAALVEECLYKSPQARPGPANLVNRLQRAAVQAASAGLAALEEANRAEAVRQAESNRLMSVSQSEGERRSDLFDAAKSSWARISTELKNALVNAASVAVVSSVQNEGWRISLNGATLEVTGVTRTARAPWGAWQKPAFDVIAHGSIGIRLATDRYGYEGREHSVWFCDASPDGEPQYQWFETAFMHMPMMNRRSPREPFGIDPNETAAKAVGSGIAEVQVAWPFTPLTVGELDEFISRWAGWFAVAAQGRLTTPSQMPERPTADSWRKR